MKIAVEDVITMIEEGTGIKFINSREFDKKIVEESNLFEIVPNHLSTCRTCVWTSTPLIKTLNHLSTKHQNDTRP
jgi:hypothetical protein